MATKQVVEPWIDLRGLYQTATSILAVMGVPLNGLLIYLIFFKTDKKLADYKIILIQNCFVDIFFNIVNDVVKGQTDYKNGAFYMIGSDYLFAWSYPWTFLAISFWVFALFCCVTSVPVQFIYRYFIIVEGRVLRKLEYFSLLAISIFLAALFGGFFGWVTWADKELLEAKNQLLKADIFYFRGIPIYMVAEIQKWPLMACFAFGNFLVTVSLGTTAWSWFKVWKKMKVDAVHFSKTTTKIHKMMTKTMVLQATVPLIFVLGPVGSAMLSAFTQINVPGLGMCISVMVCWIPVVNPLVTIISVRSYRRFVSRFLCYYTLRCPVAPAAVDDSRRRSSGWATSAHNLSHNSATNLSHSHTDRPSQDVPQPIET